MAQRARGRGVAAMCRAGGAGLAYGVSLGLLGLLIAGFAARYVAPDSAWGLQFAAVVLPWVSVGVGGAALMWAVRRRWGLALGCGGALACVLVRGMGGVWSGECAPAEGPHLTVVSFNSNSGSVALERMEELLRDVAPEVVALQELPVRMVRGDRLAGAPLLVPMLQAGYRLAESERVGWRTSLLPTFSRLPPKGVPQLLSGTRPRGRWQSGGVARMEVEWHGQRVAIYNVHLHSFGSERPWENGGLFSPTAWKKALGTYRGDFRERAEQARVLRRWLEEEPLPYLVCGDLNSTPANWVYGHLVGGLQDSFGTAGRGWGMTYPARLPLFRIDYILASSHWRVHRAYVYRGLSSDHRPVVAELSLRPSARASQ